MARFEFKLPDIGEGVTEGEIVSWLVKVGDHVAEDQEMVEVMTDKATVTIGAPKSGKVSELRAKEGESVPVGQVLVVLDLENGAREPARATPTAEEAPREAVATAVGDIREHLPGMGSLGAPRAAAPAPEARDDEARHDEARDDRARPASTTSTPGYFKEKPLAAPATRKLARELGVDLRQVAPTGAEDRVTRADVENHARSQSGGSAPEAPARKADARPSGPQALPPAQIVVAREDQRVPIRGLRKRIFENMARSKHTAAHFTYVDECDVGALKELRDKTRPYAEKAGVKLTFLPFIVKAVVTALKKHPALNCIVDDGAQEMVLKAAYDIGIAAATDAGLMVPVVRHADQRSILDIAREIDRLGAAARDGKIQKEDLGGSSFTITSLGKQGGLFATPVVNYPEVAILGVHEIKKRPVVRGDQIVVGEVMLLSLSFDHRIIDGHVGAAFAQTVISLLAEPTNLLVEMC